MIAEGLVLCGYQLLSNKDFFFFLHLSGLSISKLLLKDWCVLRVTNIVFAPLQVLSVCAFIHYCGSLPGFIKNLFYIRNVCVTTFSSVCVCAMSTSVSSQSLETRLIWSLQNELEFTERSLLWLCRSNVHLGIYKTAILVDSSGTALLFPSKHTESSFPTSPSHHTSFQEHFIGITMDKVSIKMFSDGNPPRVYLSPSLSLSPLLSHQSLWEQWGLLILAYPPQQQVLASFACEYLIKLSRTTKNLITPALNV